MQIIVLADEAGKEEFIVKKMNSDVKVVFIDKLAEAFNYDAADAFFLLKEGIDKEDQKLFRNKPVFINSTINTLKELDLEDNFCRINGWPGFLKREIWEVATHKEDTVKQIFEKLEWKYIIVTDEPGLVSARIISMIINEAYFALGERVSTKEEIDIAMKLGTNYPYGPFEWSRNIGLEKIYDLLKKLSMRESRYTIAPAMQNDLVNN